jgi:hypothetical protein
MAVRDSMRDSTAAFLQPGESVQAVIGAQTSHGAGPFGAGVNRV